ncbi:4-oxalocrotonate tautomerase family protein [Sphingobium sp. AS12]|uniref:4-oxalocrotonate tautomerase family protein n=1 Tax=Sphingobium sp. AS12 TaxID=2849495 RepID=UPI001C318E91|nr:4-oxalocrotonate tautomerase family protein [Sphingobium sp. AS12]MBV2150126.1 4-oxalocrotonate tautomerase family protein [Sphingobium sp. AS12]
MANAILEGIAVPVTTIQAPADLLNGTQEAELFRRVTDVVVEAEALPAIRSKVYVVVDHIPRSGDGFDGCVLDAETVESMLATAAAADKAPCSARQAYRAM